MADITEPSVGMYVRLDAESDIRPTWWPLEDVGRVVDIDKDDAQRPRCNVEVPVTWEKSASGFVWPSRWRMGWFPASALTVVPRPAWAGAPR